MAKHEERKESWVAWLRTTRKELDNVTWPSRNEVINLTVVVFIVTAVVSAYLGVIDYALSRGVGFLFTLN